jgi:hypothetical protein
MLNRKNLPDPTEFVESVYDRLSRLENDRDFVIDLLLATGLGVLVLVDVFTQGRR